MVLKIKTWKLVFYVLLRFIIKLRNIHTKENYQTTKLIFSEHCSPVKLRYFLSVYCLVGEFFVIGGELNYAKKYKMGIRWWQFFEF